jgi:hypothetical protein
VFAIEFDQEIDIAALGVKIAARRRTEEIKPPYMKARYA